MVRKTNDARKSENVNENLDSKEEEETSDSSDSRSNYDQASHMSVDENSEKEPTKRAKKATVNKTSEDARRKYERERKAAYRQRMSSKKPNVPRFIDLSPEEKREYKNEKKREKIKKASLSKPSKPKYIQMSPEEQKEYNNKQQRKRRKAAKEASLPKSKDYKFIKLSQEEHTAYMSQKQREWRLRKASKPSTSTFDPIMESDSDAESDSGAVSIDMPSVELSSPQMTMKRTSREMVETPILDSQRLRRLRMASMPSTSSNIPIMEDDSDDMSVDQSSIDLNIPQKSQKRTSRQMSPTPLSDSAEDDVTDDDDSEYKIPLPKIRRKKSEATGEEAEASKDEMGSASKKSTDEKGPTKVPSLDQTRKCKIRLGLIKLADVETEGIVLPEYSSFEKSLDFKEVITKLENVTSPERAEEHRKFYNSKETKERISRCGCASFNWEIMEIPNYNRELIDKQTFHVLAPTIENEKQFTAATEARLRASYLACLLAAEKADCLSLSFPILGFHAAPERSVMIGLQTIFAYMHAVELSNLELIYITTPSVKVYEKIVKTFCYVREFDLERWSTGYYLQYEEKIFGSIKAKYNCSTIPGTDMVWRCFKLPTGKNAEQQTRTIELIHNQMSEQTGISSIFKFVTKKHMQRFSAENFIRNGVKDGDAEVFNFLDIRYKIRRYCGSNQVLRKLWIISYYHMFFQEHCGAELNLDPKSDQYKERKRIFEEQKFLHVHIVSIWNHVMKHAPFSCNCSEEDHESIFVFMTRLSHRDHIIDEWILEGRSFAYNSEHDPSFLKDYFKYQANFIYRTKDALKSVCVKNKEELDKKMEESVSKWLANRDEVFKHQAEALAGMLEGFWLSEYVCGEKNPNSYKPAEFDQEVGKKMDKKKAAAVEKLRKSKKRELEAALHELETFTKALESERYCLHFSEDVEMERTLRNRYFRKRGDHQLDYKFKAISNKDLNPPYDDIWLMEGRALTVEEYIKRKLVELDLLPFDKSKDDTTGFEPIGSPVLSLYHSDTSLDKRTDYPKGLDIGDRKEVCPYCGALAFEGERSWSCCKSGAVWIPPTKKVPPEISRIFERKFRSVLISTNAAFSMASIRYSRQTQAPGGIQSLKIKGLVSCHPSAIHPRNEENPAYANFIVMELTNGEIAEKRLEKLGAKATEELKQIFIDIQEYMDKNNRLYEAFKTMKEIEEEIEKAGGSVEGQGTKFRIVPPSELTGEKLKNLQSHKGVYAQPSRMDKGYISVAYTYDPDVPMPRGYLIYSRNPRNRPQQPLSIYSDMCDLMSYPLFFPDAIGGWGLKKFKRLDKKERIGTLFVDRVAAHVAELEAVGEDPADYYDLESAEIERAVKKKRAKTSDENDEDDGSDTDDEDPMNYDNDQIIAHGELEDLQDAPVDPDEVGRMPNVKMIERGGERYPFIDRNQQTVEIPYLTGANPFGDDDSEEEPEIDRYADGTDNYQDIDGLDFNELDEYQEREAEAGPSTEVEDDEEIEREDVCYGDEHDAEPTAIGRANDGVPIQNVGTRQFISLSEYAKFIIQDREGLACRFQGQAGTLGQLLSVDMSGRIREMRMQALATKRAIFPSATDRSSLVQMYRKMLEKGFKGEKKLGMLVTMPSTVPGTSKYQRELVMSAVTTANTFGLPHLFITFTGNPKWPEIERERRKKQCQWADIPDVVNRVFKMKFEIFLEEIIGEAKPSRKDGGKLKRDAGIFGPVVWYNFSTEFQQRGMPHVHLLVCLENGITNAAEIDQIISAEVPEKPLESDPLFAEKQDYYELVRDLMVHHPCKGVNTAYCNKDKKPHWTKCCKGFPKKLCDQTTLSDNQYPDYRRNSGRRFTIHRNGKVFPAGDEYVVAHNRHLLMKYRCHMNIEIVSSIRTMNYMFKYIHKGSDRAIIEATERNAQGSLAPDAMTLKGNVLVPKNLDLAKVQQRQREADRMMDKAGVRIKRSERVALNDCSYMMDMSAMTACEAVWRISGFPMHGSSHIVHRAFVHEENKDVMFISRGVTTTQVGKMVKRKSKGMMVAWFEANLNPKTFKNGKRTQDLTLPQMLQYYKFNVKSQKFIARKYDYSRRVIGRIQAPQPRWLELTATRLLALTVKGPKSWRDLRTYRGFTHDTCLQAARARGLMNGDIEWECAIHEVSRTDIPIECRRFFVSILVHCAPADPKGLWNRHWELLVNRAPSWSDEQKKAHALRHIQFLLARHGMTLSDFELGNDYRANDLPQIDEQNEPDSPNFQRFDQSTHEREGKRMFDLLSQEQKNFVKRCITLGKSKKKQKRLVFVDGPGGTGKTFCYQVIHHLLEAAGKKTVCVSHCGLAACLLPNGCTSHRKFSIPLEVTGQMVCKMALGSAEGDAMALIDCLIWDEISMSDWRIVHAVNILLQQLKDNILPFGGVLVIMGGDWRQILPIVEGMNSFGAASYIMKNYQLWNEFEKFKLTENRRAINDPQYAEMILKIGNGTDYEDEERKMVLIPKELVEPTSDLALADWVFPDVNNIDQTKTAALLTIDNRTSLRLNNIILDKLNGELHECVSVDTADKDNAINVDPAIFATETPSGMPPHRLRLKVGAQVVLLRNISVEQGLCNGTRLTITRFGDDIIHCTVNSPTENSPATVYLHRMLMSATGRGSKNAGFKRLQYPIRLAYACTINKSQGQTLSRCGLVLHSPVFTHGQLYVAMSRVQRAADFKMWHTKRLDRPMDDDYFGMGILVKNIVFREVLRDRPIREVLEQRDAQDGNDDNSNSGSRRFPALNPIRAAVASVARRVQRNLRQRPRQLPATQ